MNENRLIQQTIGRIYRRNNSSDNDIIQRVNTIELYNLSISERIRQILNSGRRISNFRLIVSSNRLPIIPFDNHKEINLNEYLFDINTMDTMDTLDTNEHQYCSICLDSDDNINETKCKLLCEHIFHSKCIKTWLKKNFTCPYCRKIPSKKIYIEPFLTKFIDNSINFCL